MKVQAKTFDDYFTASGERETDLRELDKLIRETAPGLQPILFDGLSLMMIGYGMFHYKYASGREGDWPLIGLANQKNYMSLYVCAAQDGQYLAEKYQAQLGKVNCGRSCIRFKKLEDLDKEIFIKVIKEAEELSQDSQNLAF